jgi:pyruvate dehydrogenase E2 component (dihydrolipoamide acetyltransferase)
MPINILMPALSPTMEVGNLAKWMVKVGDTVTAGDVIAEIETDKATMEVESIDEGTVAEILVQEGAQDIAVNTLIAVLLEEGESAETITVEAPPIPADPKPATATEPVARAAATPRAGMSGSNGGGRLFASPLARRIAGDNTIDLAALTGSGPKGRIVKHDVEAALAAGTAGIGKPPAATPVKASASVATGLFEEGTFDTIPHDSMRKLIARRLTESKQTIPHFYLTLDCDIDALLALRKEINEAASIDGDGKPSYKVSVNDMVIKAMALALQAVPEANVTWTDEAMLRHKQSDIGVAVAIPGGLITPVVRQAQDKTLTAIAHEMKDYAARAQIRKLLPHEYQGGSTAISNLGMYGIKEFSAVINPPHATILAVGAGQQRPVIRDGTVATATIMSVTLSTDHRAVDGALGAQLLGAFKGFIERPISMLV